MKIYADMLFAVNFFMDFFVIYASAVMMRYKMQIKKMLFTAVSGAFVGCVMQILFLKKPEVNIITAVLVLALMVRVYFAPDDIKTFFQNCGVVLLVSFFTAGVFLWFYSYSNLTYFFKEYFSMTLAVFAVSLCAVSGIFALWHRKIRMMTVENDTYVRAVIKFDGRQTETNLFIDSGCRLRKTAEGRSIIIAEIFEIKNLLESDFAWDIMECKTAEEMLLTAEKYGTEENFEVIEFSTASGQGKMLCLKCICDFYYGKYKENLPVSVGFYNGCLFTNNVCHGIIGSEELKNIM